MLDISHSSERHLKAIQSGTVKQPAETVQPQPKEGKKRSFIHHRLLSLKVISLFINVGSAAQCITEYDDTFVLKRACHVLNSALSVDLF